jgi:hypothetical protein
MILWDTKIWIVLSFLSHHFLFFKVMFKHYFFIIIFRADFQKLKTMI